MPVTEKPTRKAELVSAITGYLRSPHLKKLWKELSELQQAAVAEAVYVTEGRYLPAQFRAKYGQLPAWESRTSRYTYSLPADILDLFFYPLGNYYGPGDALPEDLRRKLKAFVPEPKSLTLESADQPPESIQVKHRNYDYEQRKQIRTVETVPVVYCPTEQSAQQDLLAVLRLVHLGKVSVSDKTLMPGKAAIKAIAPYSRAATTTTSISQTSKMRLVTSNPLPG